MTAAASSDPHPLTLAQVQARLGDRLWRGDAFVTPLSKSVPSGFPALDGELPGGGWPARGVIELLVSAIGVGELRLLSPTLFSLSQAGRQIILAGPPRVPCADGWGQLGIGISQLLLIELARPADRLWAIEQSIKSAAFGALLAWIDDVRPEALRRLQLAAAGAEGLTFLFRPASARHHASPAPLRLELVPSDHHVLSVRIIKRRGPPLAAALALGIPMVRPFPPAAPSRSDTPLLPTLPTGSMLPTLRHALGRAALSNPATGSHPPPIA